MKLLHLIPQGTEFKFIDKRNIAFGGSILAVIASIALFVTVGLNLGIDFVGGTVIEIKTQQDQPIENIRGEVSNLNLGNVAVQEFGGPDRFMIRVPLQEAEIVPEVAAEAAAREDISEMVEGERAQQKVVTTVRTALDAAFPGVSYERTDVVGPVVSQELARSGTIAVVLAVVLMLIYIWFRFEWQFSLGAVIALTHDVLLTIGIFSITQIEFNLPIIAAILTIVGYSMNDTVVVYDRVRENLRKYKKMPLSELLDLSINDTLSRTTMTSVTTLLALGSLYVFGGEAIRGFTFAMMWGVVVGTYSSIFVAAPILLITGVKRDWTGEAHKTVSPI